MRILGISCFYHDAAVATAEDGRIIAAAHEERFSRVKHHKRLPGGTLIPVRVQVCVDHARSYPELRSFSRPGSERCAELLISAQADYL